MHRQGIEATIPVRDVAEGPLCILSKTSYSILTQYMFNTVIKALTPITLLIAIGCANRTGDQPVGRIDADFLIYTHKFKQYFEHYYPLMSIDIEQHTNVVFVPNLNHVPGKLKTIGLCTAAEDGDLATIEISQEYWDKASQDEREILLFHELGHCLLKRGHCDAADNGVHASLMNPFVIPVGKYVELREQYAYEMFHPDSRCAETHSDE